MFKLFDFKKKNNSEFYYLCRLELKTFYIFLDRCFNLANMYTKLLNLKVGDSISHKILDYVEKKLKEDYINNNCK